MKCWTPSRLDFPWLAAYCVGMGEREPRDVRPVRRWFYQLMLLLLRRPIKHFFRLQPVNTEVVPRSGAAILVANHVTLFDPIWIYNVLRRPVYFVATEELFRGRFLGGLAEHGHHEDVRPERRLGLLSLRPIQRGAGRAGPLRGG